MIASDNPAKFANELKKIYARFDTNDYNNYSAFDKSCKLFIFLSATLVGLNVGVVSHRTLAIHLSMGLPRGIFPTYPQAVRYKKYKSIWYVLRLCYPIV